MSNTETMNLVNDFIKYNKEYVNGEGNGSPKNVMVDLLELSENLGFNPLAESIYPVIDDSINVHFVQEGSQKFKSHLVSASGYRSIFDNEGFNDNFIKFLRSVDSAPVTVSQLFKHRDQQLLHSYDINKFNKSLNALYDEDYMIDILDIETDLPYNYLVPNKLWYIKAYNIFLYTIRGIDMIIDTKDINDTIGDINSNIVSFTDISDFNNMIADYNKYHIDNRKMTYNTITTKYNGDYIEKMSPISNKEINLIQNDHTKDIELFFNEFFLLDDDDHNFFKKYNLRPQRGILLTGDPGQGKTTLIKYLLKKIKDHATTNINVYKDIEIRVLQVNEFITSRILESVFKFDHKKTLLIIEDMDTIPQSLKSVFLNMLDGIESENSDVTQLFIIGTTNYPERVDKALINRAGRFDRVYTFVSPTSEERASFFRTKEMDTLLSQEIFDEIVKSTEGFSMANLNEVFISVAIAYDRKLDIVPHDILEPLKQTNKNQEKGFIDTRGKTVGFR